MYFADDTLVDRKDYSIGFYAPFNTRNNFGKSSLYELERMEFFSKEEKVENGITKVDYKEKTGRWHIFSRKKRNTSVVIIDIDDSKLRASSVWVASAEDFKWNVLLKNYHKSLHRLLEHPRILIAEFALNEIDVYEFSFFSRIYVEQLGGYFLPNKIKYKAGVVAEVEMIKIN